MGTVDGRSSRNDFAQNGFVLVKKLWGQKPAICHFPSLSLLVQQVKNGPVSRDTDLFKPIVLGHANVRLSSEMQIMEVCIVSPDIYCPQIFTVLRG